MKWYWRHLQDTYRIEGDSQFTTLSKIYLRPLKEDLPKIKTRLRGRPISHGTGISAPKKEEVIKIRNADKWIRCTPLERDNESASRTTLANEEAIQGTISKNNNNNNKPSLRSVLRRKNREKKYNSLSPDDRMLFL